jgi:hypothetical protein
MRAVLLGWVVVSLAFPAFAVEPPPLAQEQQPAKPAKRKGAGKKRDRSREKETDGTQARDRFEANTVIKSKYESGGQPLEVDPD